MTCRAVANEYHYTGITKYDELDIELYAPPDANNSLDDLFIAFEKPAGSAAFAYQLVAIGYSTSPSSSAATQLVNFQKDQKFTITLTAGGNYSGTFSAMNPATSSSASSYITEGVFTNVQL
ncbi:MAG: hypothetical protein ACRYFX_22100 [Janthinobacterium lividum]